MKNFKCHLMMIAVFGLLFSSCSKDEDKVAGENETATLTLGAALQDFNKAMMSKQQTDVGACVDGDPAFAQITLEYGGTSETVIVPILGDAASGYFTAYHDDLEIPVPSGDTHVTVTLTDFVVWADNNNDDNPDTALWVAPKYDSEYANFVTQALGDPEDPYTWNLRAGSKTYVDVEVLCFNNRAANRYGYQFFDITPTNLMKFCLFGNFCPPSGRHYTASYTVDVWEYSDGVKGDQLYFDEPANVILENGEYYADPLCFFLPDREGQDTYWFEITLRDTDEYDGSDRIILQGPITDGEIREFYDGDVMDYYHFQYGCEGSTPPPFFDPEDEAEHYKACLYPQNGSMALGFAYFTLQGDVLDATIMATNLEQGKSHMQHIHEFDDCSEPGPPIVWLDKADGTWPVAVGAYGDVIYHRTFTLGTDGNPTAAEINLLDRSVNLHGMTVDGSYSAGEIVACGELSLLNID